MMGQNTSHAVMQQRSEPNDSLDFFPTPPWATRALCNQLKCNADLSRLSVWEPACGEGHMARPLAEYFGDVLATDVHQYGRHIVHDFLFPTAPPAITDWIITNPPFRLGKEFALRGISIARSGVALLVRTAFLEGGERYSELFAKHRPAYVFQFCERVPMVKGRYDPKASTATSYCWIVWRTDAEPMFTTFRWIPPCRKHLERATDASQALSHAEGAR